MTRWILIAVGVFALIIVVAVAVTFVWTAGWDAGVDSTRPKPTPSVPRESGALGARWPLHGLTAMRGDCLTARGAALHWAERRSL